MKRAFNNCDPDNLNALSKRVELVRCDNTPGGISLINQASVVKKAPTDLIELAMEIQQADSFVHATAYGKLQVIAQQVRFLQEQAKQILLEAKTNSDLNHVACNFVKVPGNLYHLYQRPGGQTYFSMLSPHEWGNCPHQYRGSYRLEYNHSWTPIKDLDEKDTEILLINKMLAANSRCGISNMLLDTDMEM